MNKLFGKGKVLITYVSVLAILAASILSVFSGVSFNVFAEDGETGEETEAPSYPLSGEYDADYTPVEEAGIWYEAADKAGKKTSKFTGFDVNFCINPDTKGNGTAGDPYIIETANQFAAVATGNLKDEKGNWIDTQYLSFKISDDVYGFDLNNTGSSFDFSKDDVTAAEVEAELKDAEVTIEYYTDAEGKFTDASGKVLADQTKPVVKNDLTWIAKNAFKGRFDGNGACVFGLKANSTYAAVFPKAAGGMYIRNFTIKNCYFEGTAVSAFFGSILKPGSESSTIGLKHIMLNCQAYNNVLVCTFDKSDIKDADGEVVDVKSNEAIQKVGILVGPSEWPVESNMTINDCLVYGNVAKHATRDITYGIVANLHRSGSLNINNSIVMDSAPHALYYGSNAHLTSSYNNLYTNKVGDKWTNIDVSNMTNADGKYVDKIIEYEYSYKVSDQGVVTVGFNHFNYDYYKNEEGKFTNAEGEVLEDQTKPVAKKDRINMTNNGNGYSREIAGSKVFVKTDADIKGAATLEGIDPEKWTFNESGYPTPKLYRIREYSAGTNWSGEQAVECITGEGTSSSPYAIASVEEFVLMLTNPVTGAYYKLIADITINDTTAENWTENAKTWFTSNDVPAFEASLDGNGHTVSGIYYDGTQAGENVGLIPVVGDTAQISGLTIANSVIKADKGAAGAIGGTVADYCPKIIKFDVCVIEDSVKFEGDATFGGMIGIIGYSKAIITDCLSKTHGLFNRVTGEAKVVRSISVGAYPFANATDVIPEGVYTDTAHETINKEGVYVVANEDMIGLKASTNMPELNFPICWEIVVGGYPKATGAVLSAEGEVGVPWTGAIATKYAGGSGTKDDPYIIETAEQLAYFVYNGSKPVQGDYPVLDAKGDPVKDERGNNLVSDDFPYYPSGHEKQGQLKLYQPEIHQKAIKYFKLGADIYLNDLESKLWPDKVGCYDWFSQRTTKSYNNISHVNFDGDGHVIYGLQFNTAKSTGEYVRAGLFPMLGAYSTVENVGVSDAYLIGRTNDATYRDCIGTFLGCSEDFDSFLGLDSHDAAGNLEKLRDPVNDYENLAVKFKNCFVDHKSYVSAYATGGFVGEGYSATILENCLYTGSIAGHDDPYYTGALTGCDSTYGTQLRGCVVFPTTSKVKIAGGSHGSTWRSNSAYWTVYAEPVYYFNLLQQYGGNYTKITKPDDRFGEAAQEAMPLLKWEGDKDAVTGEAYSAEETWSVVEDRVPLPTVFKRNRTEEEFKALSTDKFDTPKVTVSFVTGDAEIVVPDLVGDMYAREDFKLPVLERPGFDFTGWYVFDDCSIEYPHDYFPPRDLILYAGWNQMGVIQDFENYPDTIWDYDAEYWILNKPGAKGGYKNKYVRYGSKSMHLLGNKPESADCLLNYEQMLVPGTAYTISFYVTTDKENNPPALLSLVHNDYPDYLDTGIAMENMAVVTGVKEGEWKKYTYSFTARTQWVSIRATGNSSLYFDDVIMASLDGVLSDGKVINLGNSINGDGASTLSPTTADGVSISVLICALMACAAVAVISRKNLAEVIEG